MDKYLSTAVTLPQHKKQIQMDAYLWNIVYPYIDTS